MSSPSDPNSDLNKHAQERFNRIKNKLKLDLVKKDISTLQKENIPVATIDDKRIQKLLDGEEALDNQVRQVVNSNEAFVDKSFEFIESLKLHPELSLAIGYIISGHKRNNNLDIGKAIEALERFYDQM